MELVLLLVSVSLLARAVDTRLTWWWTLFVTIALIGWSPIRQDLILGQLMIPVLALLASMWVSLRSNRALLAGVLLGLSLVVKPIIWLIPVVLALRGRLTVAAAALLAALVVHLLAGVVIGFDTLARYTFEVVPAVSKHDFIWGRNLAPAAIIETGILQPGPLAVISSVAVRGLLVVLAVAWLIRHRNLDAWLGTAICVNLLINSVTWDHYLVLAAIPAAYVAKGLREGTYSRARTVVALVTAMLLALPLGRWIYEIRYTFALADLSYIIGLVLLAWLVTRQWGVSQHVAT